MKVLNKQQIEYVVFHLNCHASIAGIENSFQFINNRDEIVNHKSKIIFLLSSEDLDVSRVIYVRGIPILYPLSSVENIFEIDQNNNLIFCHDLLKSIFFLLSGYQEFINPHSKDNLERFSYQDSIQNKLNFIDKPIVNYYFQFILDGVGVYCERNSISLQKKRLFSNFGFLLSHDIDKVDNYDFNYVIYKLKELIGLRKNDLSFGYKLKLLVKGFIQFSGLQKKENPYWNFDFMRKVEAERNLTSTFYFLDQGILHSDAYYSFDEPRLIALFKKLQSDGCEIGLHGSVESINNEVKMKSSLAKLKQKSGARIIGARQHRLLWSHPETASVQIKCGLHYDTTLGFAAHEGFRNSYCYPFKLYDFKNDRIMDLWEFPLNAMDVTLFAYQKYSPETAMTKCKELIQEIEKFGGLFSLLFHNSSFDEVTYPGITKFYLDLLSFISSTGSKNILGIDLADAMNRSNP